MRTYGNDVEVLLGSDSDLPFLLKSKLYEIFQACGVTFDVHTNLSADRKPDEVHEFCEAAVTSGTKIFIAAASMTNVLATAIGSQFKYTLPVIGVALPGGPLEGDSLSSLFSKPDGCPLIPTTTFTNAAILAVQIMGVGDNKYYTERLMKYQQDSFQKKETKDINIPEERAKEEAKKQAAKAKE